MLRIARQNMRYGALAVAIAGALILLRMPVGAGEGFAPPDKALAVRLIHATLSAINDANLTSNYTVLHALGAPEFRAAFPPQRLASALGALRQHDIDLAALAEAEPVIEEGILHPAQNAIQFRGHLTAQPTRLAFTFSYQFADQRWQLYGFDIAVVGSPVSVRAPAGTL
jgi:hypothetical protein